jgi:hypothetical protein
MKHP